MLTSLFYGWLLISGIISFISVIIQKENGNNLFDYANFQIPNHSKRFCFRILFFGIWRPIFLFGWLLLIGFRNFFEY